MVITLEVIQGLSVFVMVFLLFVVMVIILSLTLLNIQGKLSPRLERGLIVTGAKAMLWVFVTGIAYLISSLILLAL